MRRVARGALLAAAVVLATGVPAYASEAPQLVGTLAVTPAPSADGIISSTSQPTVAGEYKMNSGVVRSVTLTVKSLATPPVADPVTADACGTNCNNAAVHFSKQLAPLAYNGAYEITAKAVGRETPVDVDGDQTTTSPPVQVKLQVPPAVPKDVRAGVTGTRGDQVTINWTRNTEPDTTLYVVHRRNADGSSVNAYIEQPKTGTTVTASDTKLPAAGGQLTYQVYALRSTGDGSKTTIRSDPSSETQVRVNGTTTTTVPGAPPGTVPTPTPSGANALKFGPLPAPVISRTTAIALGKVGNFTGGSAEGVNVDDGTFNQDLPYGPTTTTEPGPAPARHQALPLESSGGSGTKALLVPLSAGAALCVVAFQLRWLNGRVSRPVDLA